MRATAQQWGKQIPCQRLILYSKFFGVSLSEIRLLYHEFYTSVNQWFGETCIMDWRNKSAIKNEDDIDRVCLAEEEQGIEIKGDAISNVIYNKASMKAYHRKMIGFPLNKGYSDDYPEYYRKHIKPVLGDKQAVKEALIQLYSEEGKDYLDYDEFDDIYGFILSSTELYSKKICGEIVLRVSCFFLDSEVDEYAERFHSFLRSIAERISEMSSVVFIGDVEDDSNFLLCTVNEKNYADIIKGYSWDSLARERYLLNVGWSTILSPVTVRLLDNTLVSRYNSDKMFTIERLKNGSLSLKLKSNVSNTKLSDLKKVRRMLYPALRPGYWDYEIFALDDSWQKMPRSRWQNAPVLDEEIIVLSDRRMRTRHQGTINTDFLFPEKQAYDSFYNTIKSWRDSFEMGYQFSGIENELGRLFTQEYSERNTLSETKCREIAEKWANVFLRKKEKEQFNKHIDSLISSLLDLSRRSV